MCYLKTQSYWNSQTATTVVSSLFRWNSYISMSELCFVLIWSVRSKNFSILFVLAEHFLREKGQKTPCPVELCVSRANAIKETSLKLEKFFKNRAGNLIRAKDPGGLEGHIYSCSNFTPLQTFLKNKAFSKIRLSQKKKNLSQK